MKRTPLTRKTPLKRTEFVRKPAKPKRKVKSPRKKLKDAAWDAC